MPEDSLQLLFERIAGAPVSTPAVQQVVARGNQLRHRTAVSRTVLVLALAAGAGLGATQLADTVSRAGGAGGNRPLPGPTRSSQARPVLPPPGHGELMLGISADQRFVMMRVSSRRPAVPVPGLAALRLPDESVVTADPAGGWVVTLPAGRRGGGTGRRAGYQFQPARLALVMPSGRSTPFGPVFRRASVVSAAVSPDGSRVAVSLIGLDGGRHAVLRMLPMPGHPGVARRTWTITSPAANEAISLSWAPDGRRLSYVAGFQTGAGIGGGPETLDTALPSSVAPGISTWPSTTRGNHGCVPDVAAWLGTSGQFGVLEECGGSQAGEVFRTANAATGAATGTVIPVPGKVGCGPLGLAPSTTGSRVLILYCGLYVADGGRLTKLPGSFTGAAIAG